jgi:hypothetical protein
MSWSVGFIGKPEKVVEALQSHSEKLNGESKVEYDSALPHLIGVVNENFGHDYPIKLTASGHGTNYGGTRPNERQLLVSLEFVCGLLV